MEAKELSCFDGVMQPHHSHMSDKISLEEAKSQVLDVATSVEALCYRES